MSDKKQMVFDHMPANLVRGNFQARSDHLAAQPIRKPQESSNVKAPTPPAKPESGGGKE